MGRLITAKELREYLGISVGNWYRKLPDLRGAGFPAPVPVFNRYDLDAVDNWLASQNGQTNDSPPTEAEWDMWLK